MVSFSLLLPLHSSVLSHNAVTYSQLIGPQLLFCFCSTGYARELVNRRPFIAVEPGLQRLMVII